MSATSEILKALGYGGATLGAGAAIHGAGLGSLLEPLDYPRRALYNAFASPFKAMESGNYSDLLGAIPGVAGGVLGGIVGGPVGVLAGSALGGALQGIGQSTGRKEFDAPSVSDLTGTEDFLPNLAVGALTDPLTYAGLGATWRAGRSALNASRAAKAAVPASPIAQAAETASIPVARLAEETAPIAMPRPRDIPGQLPPRLSDADLSAMVKANPELLQPENRLSSGFQRRLDFPGRSMVGDSEMSITRMPKALPEGFEIRPVPNPRAATGESFAIFRGDKPVKQGFASEEQAQTYLDAMAAKQGRKKPVTTEPQTSAPEIPQALPIAPEMYSRLGNALEKLPEGQIPIEDLHKALTKASKTTGGYSPEELNTTGINKMLSERSLAREAEWAKTPDGIRLEELSKGVPEAYPKEASALQKKFDATQTTSKAELVDHFTKNKVDLRVEVRPETNQQYIDYAVPGGTNHRHMLIKGPARELPEGYKIERGYKVGDKNIYAIDPKGNQLPGPLATEQQANDVAWHNQTKTAYDAHWPDDPGVIVHIGLDDRIGPNGEKLLGVNEVQSTMHQDMAKPGSSSLTIEERMAKRARQSELEKMWSDIESGNAMDLKDAESETRAMLEGHTYQKGGKTYRLPQSMIDSVSKMYRGSSEYIQSHLISLEDHFKVPKDAMDKIKEMVSKTPNIEELGKEIYKLESKGFNPAEMPLKEDWHRVGMEQAIRYAAENGYKGIVVPPGEAVKAATGGKLSGQIAHYGTFGNPQALGDEAIGEVIAKLGTTDPATLKEALAKGSINKSQYDLMTKQEATRTTKEIDDLARAYGEKIQREAVLPNWMKKYAKEHGVEVSVMETGIEPQKYTPNWTEVGGEPAKKQMMHHLPITPSMARQALTRGFPFMGVGGAGTAGLLAALAGQQQQA